jgi:hypothetical protein
MAKRFNNLPIRFDLELLKSHRGIVLRIISDHDRVENLIYGHGISLGPVKPCLSWKYIRPWDGVLQPASSITVTWA